ncbi:MAG: division/cell wall cluster transcriptional repressor MraZ [Candidatus Omnitrophica bacterium]|nr:division/cell wall cluster transcriptional repressor MraZ [Candidatus Omnitrophota bacterium]
MFYGEYSHSIDRKGRLVLPSKFREIAQSNFIERFFLTRGLDRCLFMFPEDEWRTLEQKFKNLPITKQQSRAFNRLFFSGAGDIVPDKQGRILVPQYLKDFAAIKRDVMIIGVSNRIEIWAINLWKEFYSNNQPAFESIAEELFTQT